MKIINAEYRNVYGNELLYVIDSAEAQAIKMLTGKKTISNDDIDALFTLGIIVNIIN